MASRPGLAYRAPGATLPCTDDATANPQRRVEAQVLVLVSDPAEADFADLAAIEVIDGRRQAPNIPDDAGTPVGDLVTNPDLLSAILD